MPEPFNQRAQNIIPKSLPVDSSLESQPTSDVKLLADASHLKPSFATHFSQKAVVTETGKTQLFVSPDALLSSSSDFVTDKDIKREQHHKSSELNSESTIINPPVSSSACESPYVKHPMISDCLSLGTPSQLTPKRSIPSCDNKLKNVTRQIGTSCHIPTKRLLDFSRLEGDESFLNPVLDEQVCCKVNDSISQTVEAKGINVEEEASGSVEHLQKVWLLDPTMFVECF